MAGKNYYQALGVERTASDEDLKRAYRNLSKKYHPDLQNGKTDAEKKEAEEKFKEISEAYSVLSDKKKREYYDNFGTVPDENGGHGHGVDPREFFRSHFRDFGDFDSDFGDFGFDMGGFDRNAKVNPNSPKNGKDIRIQVNVPLESALYGSESEIPIRVTDPCHHCRGTGADGGNVEECPECNGTGIRRMRNGMILMQTTCPSCNGMGLIAKDVCRHCGGSGTEIGTRRINVKIPRGIETGACLRVAGEGSKGVNGGSNGNLYVVINVQDSEIFARRGKDLMTTVYVSPVSAMLGDEVDVQTPWGVASIRIPEGTENDQVFRLHGKGMHTPSGDGDLYAKVEIETLTNLTETQKKALKRFKKTITENNTPESSTFSKMCKDFEKNTKDKR